MWLTLLGLIPGLLSAWNTYQAAKLNTQVEMYKAKTGADTATAQAVIAGLNAEGAQNVERYKAMAGNPWLTFLFVFMSMPLGLYLWQTIFIDKIVCKWIWGVTCSTDPIGGDVGMWCGIILAGTFGGGTALGIAKSWFHGRSKDSI